MEPKRDANRPGSPGVALQGFPLREVAIGLVIYMAVELEDVGWVKARLPSRKYFRPLGHWSRE
jgi:hypothetical protein